MEGVRMWKKIKKQLYFSLALILMLTSVQWGGFQAQAAKLGDNLIANPNFASSDLSAWWHGSGGATISRATTDEAIFDDVKTYGVISNRSKSYQCFAQDVTNVVSIGKEYKFSFYAMLSEDYEGAPADQREVAFAPYVTVNGQTSYLGSYSSQITGTSAQTLTPGEWTYFEGNFYLNFSGNLQEVVIRLLEQGNNYGAGSCVLGDYYVTGVSLREIDPVEPGIENVKNLKDAITEVTDENFYVGTAVTEADMDDEYISQLVTKHFNAVTLGNALKPDAIFRYSNSTCPGTKTIEFNGEQMVVPVVNFTAAENLLKPIVEWNAAHPDDLIKMRGHVLVWHSQTPEWFFHEDYNASKDYVSKEEMDKRLEWYIKTVLEHFTAEDSPYKDLFYGWDVVNEAISDSTGSYRTDTENPSESLSNSTHGSNSSWWHVYESEEYIVNAFRYANKYAPADLELYYNDYNECVDKKKEGILKLIETVKNAEGTRLDGMGMQGHYVTYWPSASDFEKALREYAEAAGSVQVTEWDLKTSSYYDGSKASMKEEYVRQAYFYLEFYNVIKRLINEGVNITGVTFWGVIDQNSWLQSSSDLTQCPLLFDNNCKVKPAYWAFVNPVCIDDNPFDDVEKPDWYYPYVKKAYDNGLMAGKGTTEDGLVKFDPLKEMTRAEFVQVLYNMEGKPAVAYTNRFTDIPNPAEDSSAWYSYAVLWAAEKGITSGFPGGSFGKNEFITREQLTLMLMKYAQLKGNDVSVDIDLSGYVDDELISDWAVPGMKWAVQNGIVSGTPEGKLMPQGLATRAEGATMLSSYYEKVSK